MYEDRQGDHALGEERCNSTHALRWHVGCFTNSASDVRVCSYCVRARALALAVGHRKTASV